MYPYNTFIYFFFEKFTRLSINWKKLELRQTIRGEVFKKLFKDVRSNICFYFFRNSFVFFENNET